MDNEKYGIELELITNKFNEKMQKVKNTFSTLTDKKINLTSNTAQIEYLKQQIKEISALLDYNAKKPFMNYNDVLKNKAELEKLTNQYNKLIGKQKEVTVASGTMHINMSKGFDKINAKIKRFGLSLLGIRTIWSLASRASSAYLSQDTELASKLQAVWTGLGAMLAPVIEEIADILLKGVKYINIFIKALTGVDLLARASAKSMANATKSAKGLSKALAGFDELTNLDTATESAGGIDNPFSAFDNVEINTGVAKVLEDIGTNIRKGWEWFTKNWKNVVLGILGVIGAIALFKLIKGLISPVKSATDVFSGFFNSLGSAIKAIAILGGFALVIHELTDLLKVFDETGISVGEVAGLMATVLVSVVALMGAVALIGPAMTAGLIPFLAVVAGISAVLLVLKITLPTILEACANFINSIAPSIKDILTVIGELIEKIILALGETLPKIIESLGNSFNKIFTGIANIVDSVGNVITKILDGIRKIIKQVGDTITQVAKTILYFINQLGPAINNFVDNAIIAMTKLINFLISGIEYLVNTLIINSINGVISGLNKIPFIDFSTLPQVNIPRFVPRLATGTNYVPEDQLAMIHKGEAVVPKKFNSKEYFGGGNEETNSLLQELIEAVGNIEINPYTTIRDVGKASLNYINSKSRQLGESVVI